MADKQDRVIFHCDCNGFFASVEALDNPALRDVPMAVAGSPESRRGIVLAKNELAKQCGIYTTQTVWQARKMCPSLVLVPPRHGRYQEVSRQVNQVYDRFTDMVEPASIDESFLDVTASLAYFEKSPRHLADMVRDQVRRDVGVTISVGVSYCKIFAKMGSDLKKPDATTLITRENYQSLLWPLPVGNMLFAGKRTVDKLNAHGIFTIGDLARAREDALTYMLGKAGAMLHRYANGVDDSPVLRRGEMPAPKSVGNGKTFAHNLTAMEEITPALSALSDEVAARLREGGQMCQGVQLSIKSPDLQVISRQTRLQAPTWLHKEILDAALALLTANWQPGAPIRALTVTAEQLVTADEAQRMPEQISFLDALAMGAGQPPAQIPGEPSFAEGAFCPLAARQKRAKMEKLEETIQRIRAKHGEDSVGLGFGEGYEVPDNNLPF